MPQNRTVSAQEGDTLLDAALQHGIPLEHECGGNCACTTCHVIVREGGENLSPMEEVEADRLSTAEGLTPASRLACQAILRGGDVMVFLPLSSTGPLEIEGRRHVKRR
ncbi:MAG TPA: 2Fe-2S iron-sulfur cluster-binding protein [Chthonomonadaceae bacterium]|nr:2Fe-2S iron-sulfur cluster-binding protein [Chthonomonadaceae bacterium]